MSDEQLRTPSLARRVVVTSLVLLAVLLIVMGVLLDAVLANRLDAQLRDRLLDRAAFARVLVEDVGPDDARAEELAQRLEGEDISVKVTDTDGEVRTAGRLPGAAPAPPTPGGPGPRGPAADQVSESTSVLSVSEQVGDLTIELYADRTAVARVLTQVRLALLLSGLAVLAVAALVIGPVVRRALAPLAAITGVARAITAGDRGRRLRPDRPGTELGVTATAFDAMLDAVEGAEQQARASEERLRDFVSDAAHELRTPVTGIRASAEHLLRAGPQAPREQQEQLLLTLVRESGRAGRLVDDLLLMARIDRGLELDRRPLDLHELATQVADARRHAHPGLRLGVSGAPVTVTGDADRLQQVLANLVDNAAQATGGSGKVELRVTADGAAAGVEVVDDGPGVPPADRGRVFERLVRLDASRERRTGGAGLGLPIARGIARAHGGDLVCADPAGPGAVFRLSLPRTD